MSNACEVVMRRHMEAVSNGDVDALIADYADDAVILRPDATIKGKAEIAVAFRLLTKEIANASVIDSTRTDGDYQLIAWHAPGGIFGSELFHVRNGKIIFQSIAIHVASH